MKARELANLGVPKGDALRLAIEACISAAKAGPGVNKEAIRATVTALLADPAAYEADAIWGPLAAAVAGAKAASSPWKKAGV